MRKKTNYLRVAVGMAVLLCGMMVVQPDSMAQAASKIKISAQNFPDRNFRTAVKKFDTNKDGYLQRAEIKKVKSIRLKVTQKSNWYVASFQGIEHFTELQSFTYGGTCYKSTRTLDLSKKSCAV